MRDQNIDLGENSMAHIDFPTDFPSLETMMSVLKKVFEKSWKIDLDIEDINIWLENFNGKFLM